MEPALQPPPAAEISEPLTWAQICERYPDQHVYLVEINRVAPRSLDFHTARVVGHSAAVREALDQAMVWRDYYYELGRRFTGRPKGVLVRPSVIFDDETRDGFFNRR